MDSRGENSGDSVELKNVPLSHFFTVTDPSAIMIQNGAPPLGDMPTMPDYYEDNKHPYVEIVEQPQQRGFRFRYECEGPSHGGLQGVTTERNSKVYPSIRVANYEGPAQIEVSLVTDEDPPHIHAHKLVGKNCVDGVCRMIIASTASIISFPNLCIQHVTKKKAAEVLLHRIMEEDKLQKQMAGTNLSPQPATENVTAKKQAQDLARNMTLNAVRLQFRVFLPNAQGQYLIMLPPVVSQPIYDSKSPGASALKICRMDKFGGCCTGNEEVFLLCEKVQKEDIMVRFVEQDNEGNLQWEAYGNFSPLDVHRQYAIVFKTPPYVNPNIDRAVNVLIMLQRKSDNEVSEAKAFTYYPQNKDKDLIGRKKRKKLPLDGAFSYYNGDGGLGGGAAGPSNGIGGIFGPLGPGLFGGSSGGGMDQNIGCYSVILPNGSVVDQRNVLPETVEEAVKEEFSHSPAETLNLEDLCQEVMDNSMGTAMWSDNHFDDLEMDAAPSLRHPSQLVTPTTGSLASSLKSKPHVSTRARKEAAATRDDGSKKDSGGDDDGKQKKDSVDDRSPKDSGGGDDKPRKGSGGKDSKPRKDSGDDDKQTGKDTASGTPDANKGGSALRKGEVSKARKPDAASHEAKGRGGTAMMHSDRLTAFAEPDSVLMERGPQTQHRVTLIIDSQEAGESSSIQHHPQPHSIPSEAERGEHDDTVASSTRMNEVSMSEGVRTDEGFSEVSEVSSGREEILEPERSGCVPPPPPKMKGKREGADTEDVTSGPVRAATAVVKRIIQKITAKTVLALRDYSETGDPRYLLLVQRHLTAIRNENGDLPLHLAVINNQTTALRHLLAVMISLPNSRRIINTFNYIRQTALHLAAIMQQTISMELLLHAGADPSLSDRNGNTPAHLAVLNSSVEGLRSLVKYLRPGVIAANPFPELDYLNYDGYSPVHLAAQQGSVEMLRLLVQGQADVDLGDGKSGRTALHHAVDLDDLPVAGFLLMEANADVNARCFGGNTPLHVACCKGLIGMVALLMTAGALTDVENEEIPSEDDYGRDGEVGEQKEGVGGRSPPVPRCRRGLQPRDYAAGKDRLRILRMLMGDFTTQDQPDTAVGPEFFDDPDFAVDPDLEERGDVPAENDLEQDMGGSVTHKSSYDSGVAVSILTHSAASPPVKEEKLSQQTQTALCKILDPEHAGKDVMELAQRLGYDNLVPALEVMASSDSSPTLYLLDYNETYGSLSKLRECIKAMQLDEAVKVLDGHL